MMFLGLDKTTWEFINSFSPWLSAIGTLGAVIVALYLARGRSRLKLHITVGHGQVLGLVTTGPPDYLTTEPPDYLCISIVNTGFRTANITKLVWKIGLFKKIFVVQIPGEPPLSSSIPMELADGQQAHYMVPFKGETDWLNTFARDYLGNHPVLMSHFITLQVFTSVGKTFEKRIEKNLRKKLIEAAQAQRSKAVVEQGKED